MANEERLFTIKSLKEEYINHYVPLIEEFRAELNGQQLGALDSFPRPFFPLFGNGYEESSVRLVVVGQDTKNSRGIDEFLRTNPRATIEGAFREVENVDFTEWGPTSNYFFGFVMKFLAKLHGVPNWNVMKHRQCKKVLSSFGYGNVHPVEMLKTERHGISSETWSAISRAGKRLYGVYNSL